MSDSPVQHCCVASQLCWLTGADPCVDICVLTAVAGRFTYGVKALGLACDTHHFQVSGKDVKEHAAQNAKEARKESVKETVREADMADRDRRRGNETVEKQTAAVDDASKQASVDSTTLPTLHEINPTITIPPLGLTDTASAALAAPAATMDSIAPAVDRASEQLDLNTGVCPLLPFTQQLTRASSASSSSDGLYTLAFHNQSPSLPLAFLDVHFAINSGPTANLRLISDRTTATQPHSGQQAVAGVSNEVRGLKGIAMMEGDTVEYSFTYGVKEGGGVDGKVRACNTEVYRAKVNESIK